MLEPLSHQKIFLDIFITGLDILDIFITGFLGKKIKGVGGGGSVEFGQKEGKSVFQESLNSAKAFQWLSLSSVGPNPECAI